MNPCHTHIDDLCTEEDSHQCHWSCHSGLAECDMSLVSLVSLVEECHCTLCEHWDPTELWSLWHCSACHCTLYSSTSVTLSRLWESLLTINIIISNIIVSVFSRPVLTLMMCGDLILTSLSGLQSPVVSDQVTCVQCVQCTCVEVNNVTTSDCSSVSTTSTTSDPLIGQLVSQCCSLIGLTVIWWYLDGVRKMMSSLEEFLKCAAWWDTNNCS